MPIQKDGTEQSTFTIRDLLVIFEKGDDMTVREKKYLNKCLSNLYNYKGGVGYELEFTPDEEQLNFIKIALPYLINNSNTRINQIMEIYSLNVDMVFWNSSGQDLLSHLIKQNLLYK